MVRDGLFHSEFIAMLVNRLAVNTYLELGIANDETMSLVAETARAETRLIGVDRAVTYRSPNVEYFEMDTEKFTAEVLPTLGTTIGLAFIDADHSYDAAMRDLGGIWPFVGRDGLVLLHDTNPATEEDTAPGLCGDSWRIPEVLHGRTYEAVTLPYSPGLTIVRKRFSWCSFK